MKRKILFLFSFLSISVAEAQYIDQPLTTVSSYPISNISVVDENIVWAKLATFGLFKTVDGGQNWQYYGNLGSNYNRPVELFAKDGNTAFYIDTYTGPGGGGGKSYSMTTDGGATWGQAIFNTGSGTFNTFNYIHFFDPNNGYLHSPQGSYITTNGGALWTNLTSANFTGSQTPVSAASVLTVLNNTMWGLVSGGRMAKSTDKGQNWSVFTPSGINSTSFISATAFTDTNNGILVEGTQLKGTSDGGLTWINIPHTGEFRSKIAGIPGTSSYISTGTFWGNGPSNNIGGFAFSNDNGYTWMVLDSFNIHSDVGFASSNAGWTGGHYKMHKFIGSALGISGTDFKEGDFLVYPNPGTGIFKIESQVKGNISFKVMNALGKEILKQEMTSLNKLTLDFTNQPKGIYLLQISNEKQQIVKKLVLK
ncbi:T9SS type A sorting domain-containing protein [Adhaeribacter soli]|uniref:T9SS type A sorting domain-containing protein n=1 Tax=Adhaeribacter soli TaxID=2607655 RepID=A0A5N1IUZ4_9BACT|nr:T9SS type A sorting domain-containing protein [Adhaeribacter soli]KAA9331759.1 T9SS type A sorting domain-containing protein [Adhaeribacter soli]